MKRILKWFGIGVLSIVILFLAQYGMLDLVVYYLFIFGYLAGGFVTAALFLWKRRYALIGGDPIITIAHAGAIVIMACCGSHICNTSRQSVLSRKILGWSA